jgi:RHS repeat-associated protein
VAALTSTAFAEFKAPLPEFKNEKQLAEWRAEKASESTSQGYEPEASAFYTGKPYLAATGDYAFRYRNYFPEAARWTTEDPSGFPDGANIHSYIKNNPTSKVDYEGLASQDINHACPYTSLIGVSVSLSWHGIYKWSFVEDKETSKIEPDGFSGTTPASGTYQDNELGVTFSASLLDRSGYDTKMIGSQQWKRFKVDLQVRIWKEDTALMTNRSLHSETSRFIKVGHWYE